MAGYSMDRIGKIAFPVPVRRGAWWVHSWTVTVPAGFSLDGCAIPEPLQDSEGGMVVLVVSAAQGEIRLDCFEKNEIISPAALIYVSQIVHAVRADAGNGVLVDGDADHPLFFVVRG
ncbi:hypothetical protein ACGFNU_45945 [Spirillospora sp. NPDC048911]|uniref:hypothetical protein n=1 Tax=Spirillospora sp. NPDC048911 TaxID=3364527 RepID=UPI0037245DAA